MVRESLLSLFGEFERYARDVAAVQRRGYRREAWSYAKLAQIAVGCALELRERGVRTGERVLIWGPNSAEWMAAFWGCLLRGAVAVPMDDGATAEFAQRVARDAAVKLAIVAREKTTAMAAGKTAVPTLVLEDLADIARKRNVIATASSGREGNRRLYETLADEPPTKKHIAQILFTSGTTAAPRGVVLTHGNFLANLEPLERGIDPYRKYERWLHPLRFVTLVPLSHVFGQFMALFVPPLLGAAVVFEGSANPGEILRTVKRERATALISVPRMLDLLRGGILREMEGAGRREWFERTLERANGKEFLRRAWSFRRIHRRLGWKFWAFISGGAALSSETEDFFKRMGYAVVQGYGMTETASLVSLNHPFRAARGTIGKVLPGREFRLAEDGEILVRGENVASGYWEGGKLKILGENDEMNSSGAEALSGSQALLSEPFEAQDKLKLRPPIVPPTLAPEQNGTGEWLRTGDIGETDAEGNLRFRGRKKNVIVTPAGLNVYPEDLEVALRKQAGVRDCVVIPRERDGNAEACAVLLLSSDVKEAEEVEEKADAAAVVERANAGLAEYQRMREWVVWPDVDFPRTATGKPRLAAIAERVAGLLNGGSGTAGKSAASGETEIDDLLKRFARAREADSGEAGVRLEKELKLSSLDRVELMSALEEKFHVELNETAFSNAKTVGDVQRLLREPDASRSVHVYPRWTQREPVRWLRLGVYYALAWPATWILGHPRIVGRENLRGVRGPVLVVSNHVAGRADIGLVLAALPMRFRNWLATAMAAETLRELRYAPKEWFFVRSWAHNWGYWLVTLLFNVFPLPRFSGFRESLRFAGESVDRGYSVLVFPEGVVNNSETGELGKFYGGIGLLAENLRIPIVPMRLDGVWEMRREGRRLAKIGELTLRIGKPVSFPAGIATEEIAGRLEKLVRDL